MRIFTEQAPSAKPVNVGARLTNDWKTIIDVPDYNVPVVGFGTERRIAPGVAEISSALLASNVSQQSAGLYIRIIKALVVDKSPKFDQVVNPGGFEDATILLTLNRDFVQAEVGAFVELNYPGLLTPEQLILCKRDSGFILDALVADLLSGGSTNSVNVALAYFNNAIAVLPSPQVIPTIKAISFLGELASDIMRQNTIIAQNVEGVTQLFSGTIIVANPAVVDIAIFGLIDAINDTLLVPKPSSSFDEIDNAGGFEDAANLLILNRAFIQAEVVAYVESTYPGLLTIEQSTLCKRDVGFIVDALVTDLIDGGTLNSIEAALAYYNNAVSVLPSPQVAPTIDAISYIGTLSFDIIRQQAVVPVLNIDGIIQEFDGAIVVINPEDNDVIINALISAINDTIENPVLSEVFILAENIPVEPRDTLIFPVNGQFLLTGDRLQVRSSTDNSIMITLSYTEGQAEEDDVPGGGL